MLPNINPKQMQAMMKQLGMKQDEIDALRVVIECADKNIIVEPASVQKITMQGQSSFQIAGEIREENKAESIREEDVEMVAEKTGKSKEEAESALKESGGDIASAIIKLS